LRHGGQWRAFRPGNPQAGSAIAKHFSVELKAIAGASLVPTRWSRGVVFASSFEIGVHQLDGRRVRRYRL
jgi:hypothetical protein